MPEFRIEETDDQIIYWTTAANTVVAVRELAKKPRTALQLSDALKIPYSTAYYSIRQLCKANIARPVPNTYPAKFTLNSSDVAIESKGNFWTITINKDRCYVK